MLSVALRPVAINLLDDPRLREMTGSGRTLALGQVLQIAIDFPAISRLPMRG